MFIGRIDRNPLKSLTSSPTAAQHRTNRRNAAKQHQLKKRHELVEATRLFSGVDGVPRIVAVIPLSPDVNAQGAVRALIGPLDLEEGGVPEVGIWRTKYIYPCRSLGGTLS